LAALGFARAEIDAANSFCCGAMTWERAPHLKPKHQASSTAPTRAAAPARYPSTATSA